jgi:hypothetical protein
VSVILLGPQRRPTVHNVLRSLHVEGQIAVVTAGWREREPNDEELKGLLNGASINLSLYRRWLDVQERDPDLAAAQRRLGEVLDELHEIYLVRLDYALRAIHAVQHAGRAGQRRADAVTEAVGAARELDARHLDAIGDICSEFYATWTPPDRPVVTEHRAAVEELVGSAGALVITGGHVGVLGWVLHLFGVAAALRSPVIAWSAGAMALTDRIVLFHDRAPQGPGNPEAYRRGLSVVHDMVALPHARARLLIDDAERMAVFARRFAPARCVLFEQGTRVDTDARGTCPPGTRILGEDGRVRTVQTPGQP